MHAAWVYLVYVSEFHFFLNATSILVVCLVLGSALDVYLLVGPAWEV